MEYVEAEGNSIDDAIERAVAKLGVTRDRVDVEILGNASKGLFGLGGKKAKVRATLRSPLNLDADSAPTTPERAPRPAPQPRGERAADGARPERTAARTRPERPARQARAERPAEQGRPERPARPGRPERPARQGRPEQRERPARSDGRPARAKAAEGNGEDRPRPPRREKRVEERPTVEIDEATLEHARETLEHAARLIGTEAQVRVVRDDLGTSLMIEGDESGILIGRRGQTLDALEYMINRIASRDTRHTTHLVVDSHGYRQRRREALEALAQRMGERAEQRGKPVTMNPMSPRDRRIVHLALEAAPGVETRSAGEGYFRKLLIIPRR